MKKILSLLVYILFTNILFAQRLEIAWHENPVLHTITNPAFLKESAVIVSQKTQLQISETLDGGLSITKRVQKVIKVNDEKGIEMYNKVKIPYSKENPIFLIKARSINPSGKVIELNADAFKDVKEEDGTFVKLFALEGIEKGSEIEFMYFVKQRFVPFGTDYLQDMIPTIENYFELVSTDYLKFDFKGYNGTIVEKDSTKNDKVSKMAYTKNMPGLIEEKYASYISHFARVEYIITNNLKKQNQDKPLYTWNDIIKNLHYNYTHFTKKEIKEGKNCLDKPEYKKLQTEEQKIAWIEHYVKTNFVQQQYVETDNADAIEAILKNKITTEAGIRNLMALLFKVEDIKFEIGYTCNRFYKTFDYDFINPDNLSSALFYFPNSKIYVAPNEIYYRTPYIPSVFCNQYAVFSKTQTSNNTTDSVIAEKVKIPELSAENSFHNHEVSVRFNADMDTTFIQMTNVFQGQNMLELLPAFIYVDKDKQPDLVKEIIQINNKDEKMDNIKIENNSYESLQKKIPLKLSATISSVNSLDKAGNKYLFKIGELIGRQAEMYQERERQFDIEIPNPHQYTRTINVTIPDGYKVNNLDKLNMNVVANLNNRESCKFISSYTLNKNVLTVNVFEKYNDSFVPKSEFNNYKKVINAAADFNKIVIVLDKK